LTDDAFTETGADVSLKELAAAIGAEPPSDGASDVIVRACKSIDAAGPGDVTFLSNPKYADQLDTTGATAAIVAASVTCPSNPGLVLLKTKDPYYAWSLALVRLHGHRRHPHAGVHPSAHVDKTASIGEGTVIYPGAFVGPRTKVGRDCILYPNVVVYDDCVIGDRVIIHAGSSIGPDGFGFATHKDADGIWRHHKIPQVGNVIIEDDVEIGSNTSISRGAVGNTVIGQGTKIDNNVAIGHGVRVGAHGLLVAHVGVAGSTTIGHHATIAGQVGITGHIKIGDGVTIAAQSGVMADVPDQTTVIGSPAMPASHARRVYFLFTQLPTLQDRIKKLEQAVEELGDDGDEDGKHEKA
jgi:UDP-3-O-[3-hydroxymyristoyl] glucosamine N-acyltransferase